MAYPFTKALRRDDYRCMVTREFETKYLDSLPLAEQALIEQVGIGAVATILAYIFPPSPNWGLTLQAGGRK